MDIAELATQPYVALTTYRRDGTPVSTPVWAAPDGTGLVVWTPRRSGKVKRLSRTDRVALAPCDRTGRVTGDSVEMTARLLSASRAARQSMRSKYGRRFSKFALLLRFVQYTRLDVVVRSLRRASGGPVVIEIRPVDRECRADGTA